MTDARFVEIDRLMRVLHEVLQDAGFAIVSQGPTDVPLWCIQQYNRVLIRLETLDKDLARGIRPLSEHATALDVRMAARQALVLLGWRSHKRGWMSTAGTEASDADDTDQDICLT